MYTREVGPRRGHTALARVSRRCLRPTGTAGREACSGPQRRFSPTHRQLAFGSVPSCCTALGRCQRFARCCRHNTPAAGSAPLAVQLSVPEPAHAPVFVKAPDGSASHPNEPKADADSEGSAKADGDADGTAKPADNAKQDAFASKPAAPLKRQISLQVRSLQPIARFLLHGARCTTVAPAQLAPRLSAASRPTASPLALFGDGCATPVLPQELVNSLANSAAQPTESALATVDLKVVRQPWAAVKERRPDRACPDTPQRARPNSCTREYSAAPYGACDSVSTRLRAHARADSGP